ncbi:hypothetical protein Hoch_3463 [Haliangium ochraceum DSM 14365]|uniref:DUF4410 domain-containing protein n=2 Tax=Haliangium ochraceum TaxID=80816 RepID=D0LW33_HALO1|nr:hypothetical protein Hoch_3463 [Haliangium ochraceum DSM 14365]
MLAALLALALVAGAASSALAAPRGQAQRYCFLVTDVKTAEGVPPQAAELVRERLRAAIEKDGRLLAELPADAPDPDAEPKAFEAFVRKHKLTPYRVNVEVISYHRELETDARDQQRLSVHMAVRTFGETMPVRVMAFSGNGQATLKIRVGQRLRERDIEYARTEATDEAVAQALAESIAKLDAKNAEPPKRGRGKKKR